MDKGVTFAIGIFIGCILSAIIYTYILTTSMDNNEKQIIKIYERKIDSINYEKCKEIDSLKHMSDSAIISKLQDLLSDYK